MADAQLDKSMALPFDTSNPDHEHVVSLSLVVYTSGDDEDASIIAGAWCDTVNDYMANRQSVDSITAANVQLYVEDEQPTIVNHLNPGSLRKLGEKTGSGIVNRFGPYIREALAANDWDGESEPVEHIVTDILNALHTSATRELMAFLGYDH